MRTKALRAGMFAVAGAVLFGSVALANIISGSSTTNSSNDILLTQLVLPKPADATTTGDLLLANIAVNGGSPAGITAPAGWTLIARTDNGTNVSIVSYYKVTTASEPSTYTWTISPASRAEGGITHYSGVNSANPIDTFAGSTGHGTTATAPSVTTSAAGDQVIALYAMNAGLTNTGHFSVPSGMTEKYDTANAPFGPSVATDDLTQAAAGATGTFASTITTILQKDWAAQTIALKMVSPTTLTTGLVSYWKFDETSGNAADSVGSNTLTNNNGAIYDSGIIGHGIDFGSSNTNESLSLSAPLIGFTSDFTYNFWVKINTVPINNGFNSAYALFLDNDGMTPNHMGYQTVQYSQVNGVTYMYIDRLANGDDDQYSGPVNLGVGTWHMITYTKNGPTIALYIDGNSSPAFSGISTQTGDVNPHAASQFTIGTDAINNRPSNAAIDEFGAWTRVLTSGEISQLYNVGVGNQYPF